MSFLLGVVLLNSILADAHLTLSILPLGRDVVVEQHTDLNLTCRVLARHKTNDRYELSWKLPIRSNVPIGRSSASSDRITVYQRNDQITITIHNLQDDDSGLYVCKLQEQGIIWTRKISVFVRTKECTAPFFDCGSGLCISKHYVCDGYVDCPNGYDEANKHCGQDACMGKMLCDGRCIHKELCCDPNENPNCTAKYLMPCCQNAEHSGEVNSQPCAPSDDCNYGRYLGFGNSILYIVASCAGVVMVVSTVIMFLACRICSRHSEELQRWARVPANGMHRQYMQGVTSVRDSDSTENIDFLFDDINSDGNQGNSGSETPDDFVLLNFVPGYGFEIAECGPKPPPYTENAIGIPPPPYESSTDLSESTKPPSVEAGSSSTNENEHNP